MATSKRPSDPKEAAARVRAARAYADINRKELGERIGKSASTIERIEQGKSGSIGEGGETYELLWAIAKACGYNPEWMIDVVRPDADQPTTEARLRALERSWLDLQARVEEEAQTMDTQLASDVAELQESLADLRRRLARVEHEAAASRS